MAIDIFNIQPTKLCTSLSGRFVLLYGQPKSGKTSTAALWDRPLLCAFEKGYNALVGVKPADITSWADFKSICRQLKQAKKSDDSNINDMYRTVIVDTVSIAYKLCEKHIIIQQGINSLSDLPYGKGYDLVKAEFEDTFRELTMLGYAIVFICHSKTKQTEYVDEEGNTIDAIAPDLANASYQIINRLVDLIGYIAVEYDKDGKSHRYIYTRGTPRVFAGSRYKYLAPKIELGYQQLVDAIAEAMKKEAEMTGTELDNRSATEVLNAGITRPFSDVMNEARALWTKIIDTKGEEGREAIRVATKKVFGQDIQLSRATEEQQNLVELVIEEFKEILK